MCFINQVCLALLVHQQTWLITTVQQIFTGEEVATEGLNQQPHLSPCRRVDEFSEWGLFKVTSASLFHLTRSNKQPHPQNYIPKSHACTNTQYMHKILRHTHTHNSTQHPTWLWRSSNAPPTPLSISPVWKHFKQTCTLLPYKKGKLQDMLSSIPAGLIRIVLNRHCHAF